MGYLEKLLKRELSELEDALNYLETQDVKRDKACIKVEIAKVKSILASFSDEM